MSRDATPLDLAYRRVNLLKRLVRAERIRAQADPSSDRNVSVLGIVEPGTSYRDAKEVVTRTFNELELLLDQLCLTHMAASFERQAMVAIEQALRDSAAAIETQRGDGQRWPTKLLRQPGELQGLKNLEDLIPMDQRQKRMFKSMRTARNEFVHAGKIDTAPEITDLEALGLLASILQRLT